MKDGEGDGGVVVELVNETNDHTYSRNEDKVTHFSACSREIQPS